MSFEKKIKKVLETKMHEELGKVFSSFRGHVVAGVEAELAAAKDMHNALKLCKKHGCTDKQVYSYAKSHAGLTEGRFKRYVKFHKYWDKKVPADLLFLCDVTAMWFICRMPDALMAGAVREYVSMIRQTREKVNGVYVRGQVVTWDSWRWGKYHTRWKQDQLKKTIEGLKDALKVRTGRIVNPNDKDPIATIKVEVTGTSAAKPTKIKSKNAVNKLIKTGEIQFDD